MQEHLDADEIAVILEDRLRVETDALTVPPRHRIEGIAYAAVKIAEQADVDRGTAYAAGYSAALNDCERADVGQLVARVSELEARLAFEVVQRQIAERRYEGAAAMAGAR